MLRVLCNNVQETLVAASQLRRDYSTQPNLRYIPGPHAMLTEIAAELPHRSHPSWALSL